MNLEKDMLGGTWWDIIGIDIFILNCMYAWNSQA